MMDPFERGRAEVHMWKGPVGDGSAGTADQRPIGEPYASHHRSKRMSRSVMPSNVVEIDEPEATIASFSDLEAEEAVVRVTM